MNVTIWVEVVKTVMLVAACFVFMKTCSRVDLFLDAYLRVCRENQRQPETSANPRRKRTPQATRKAAHLCAACGIPLPKDPANVALVDETETYVYVCQCGTEIRSKKILSEEVVDNP